MIVNGNAYRDVKINNGEITGGRPTGSLFPVMILLQGTDLLSEA